MTESNTDTHTISFVILDDLSNTFKPIEIEIGEVNRENVTNAVDAIAKQFGFIDDKTLVGEYEHHDVSRYYFESAFSDRYKPQFIKDRDDVIDNLITNGYSVWNRFNKYYVIAWAVDHTRFEVYSKDCDKMLIQWGEGKNDGEIKGMIEDEDYNENPVITMMKALHS